MKSHHITILYTTSVSNCRFKSMVSLASVTTPENTTRKYTQRLEFKSPCFSLILAKYVDRAVKLAICFTGYQEVS